MSLVRVALINHGLVDNVVLVEDGSLGHLGLQQSYDTVIETNTAGPGWRWTPEDGFTPPDPRPEPVSPQPVASLSRLEFLRRFTPAERKAIFQARKNSFDLDDFMYLLELADSVRLDNADVTAGLALLEAGGLLATGRAAEILAG